MSKENLETMRAGVDAFNRRDVEAAIAMSAADIEFETVTGKATTGTTHRGHDGLRTYFAELPATWAEIAWEAVELRDLGSRGVLLLATLRATGSASGVEVAMPFGTLWEFSDAKVRRMRAFLDHAAALAAAGLVE